MERKKHDVYEYDDDGVKRYFSRGITRSFGENKIIFVDGHQIFSCVQPLHDSKGLTLIGYLYT